MDYANRKPKKQGGRNSKKSSTAKRRGQGATKRQTQTPQVPWVIVIIAIVLIGGFAYGLIAINGSSEDVPAHKAQAGEPEDVLPEKPVERWQYIEELEQKKVEVDVPERELGPPKLMQCGSFRQQDDAQRLRAEIAMAGLESQIRATEGKNGLWYRVILGPYKTKREAEKDRHKLQRARVYGCAIWNWNLD